MGDWLVYYGKNQENLTLFVRFPRSLFNAGMANRASNIQFGGLVTSPTTSLAPMRSGYRPMLDVMASTSMSNIQLTDQNKHAYIQPLADMMAAASMSNIQLIDQDGHASPMKDN